MNPWLLAEWNPVVPFIITTIVVIWIAALFVVFND